MPPIGLLTTLWKYNWFKPSKPKLVKIILKCSVRTLKKIFLQYKYNLVNAISEINRCLYYEN